MNSRQGMGLRFWRTFARYVSIFTQRFVFLRVIGFMTKCDQSEFNEPHLLVNQVTLNHVGFGWPEVFIKIIEESKL